MGELVEDALDPEVGREREREDARVRRQVAARVVADQQHRPLLGHVAQAAHLGAEVERRGEPQRRQVLADVVGVSIVEVRARDLALDLPGDATERPGDQVSPVAGPFRLFGRVSVAGRAVRD